MVGGLNLPILWNKIVDVYLDIKFIQSMFWSDLINSMGIFHSVNESNFSQIKTT
jgi:hypothetical protein